MSDVNAKIEGNADGTIYRIVGEGIKEHTDDKTEALQIYNSTLKKLKKEEDSYSLKLQSKGSSTGGRWKVWKQSSRD